jgi:hypothetical protein
MAAEASSAASVLGSSDGGYSFKTLWQEATRAVGYITDMAMNIAGINAQKEMNRDTELGKTNRSMATSAMLNSAMPVMLLIVAALIIFGVKKRKG